MNGISYRRLKKMRRLSYETSLRSELSVLSTMLRTIPMPIYPRHCTHGMKLFSDSDRKEALRILTGEASSFDDYPPELRGTLAPLLRISWPAKYAFDRLPARV